MKYCSQCGAPSEDNAVFCSKCGHKFVEESTVEAEVVDSGVKVRKKRDKDVCQIAFIFCVIGTVIAGFGIIPLIWCIPLTYTLYNRLQKDEPIGIGLKVVILLFVSLIGGILLLIGDPDND